MSITNFIKHLKEANKLRIAGKCLLHNNRYSTIINGKVYTVFKKGTKHYIINDERLMF